MPEGIQETVTDMLELAAGTSVYSSRKRQEWLKGRYASYTWDM